MSRPPRGGAHLPTGPRPCALGAAWLPRDGEEGEGQRPSPGWRRRDAGQTHGFPSFPRRVPPSLPHLRECSDFIKVIFQEIASGSQVTARSAPEHSLFCPPCSSKVERTEQKCLGWTQDSWKGKARRKGPGRRTTWPRAPGCSRLGSPGVWKGRKPELRLLKELGANCTGVQGFTAPGQQSPCLKRSMLGPLPAPGSHVWHLRPSTVAARVSRDPCFCRGLEPLDLSCIFKWTDVTNSLGSSRWIQVNSGVREL